MVKSKILFASIVSNRFFFFSSSVSTTNVRTTNFVWNWAHWKLLLPVWKTVWSTVSAKINRDERKIDEWRVEHPDEIFLIWFPSSTSIFFRWQKSSNETDRRLMVRNTFSFASFSLPLCRRSSPASFLLNRQAARGERVDRSRRTKKTSSGDKKTLVANRKANWKNSHFSLKLEWSRWKFYFRFSFNVWYNKLWSVEC